MANRAKGALGAFMVAFTAAFFALGLAAPPSHAHAAEGDLTADTELVCTMDAQGNLTLPKATLTNNGSQDMVLESATCPAGFDWEFDLVGTTIPAGSSVTGTWTAKSPLTFDQAAAVAAAGKYLAGKFTYTANATGPQAFAVYSQTDNSLNFYKRSSVPAVGDTFEGKTVTEVYTGFETDSYWYGDAPWFYSQSSNAKTVAVVDEGIQPVSTRYWFYGMSNCTSMELSKLDTSNVTSMNFMFSGCSSLADLDVSGFDTQNVTNMYGMFSDCESLISLDLTKFDTSKVTSMNSMFESCSSLASLDLSEFKTQNVKDMGYMFNRCSSLISLNVAGFDTSNVTSMTRMFSDCKSLISLDLSGFDTASVTNMSSMFESCSSLASLNLSGLFNTSAVTNMEFMFYYMYELQEVKLGANFKFVGTGGELPTPLGDYITGADGSWYNSAGTAYAPADVPSNVADTYYASKRLVPAAASATALGLDAVDEEDTSSASIDADDGLQDSVTEAGSPICPDSPLLGTLTVEADPEDKGTLVAVASGLPDDAVPAFQWYRSGSPVQGASSDSYALTEPDVGSSIECRLSDSLGRYIGTITSNAVLVAKEPDGSISASIA